ncbi:MAG TPA: hypothetical protein VL754_21500 [Verrucomicrobiae bacterium]|nr:hypothetical protein [Verrucomicrobiae bacterium]
MLRRRRLIVLVGPAVETVEEVLGVEILVVRRIVAHLLMSRIIERGALPAARK